MTYPHDEVQSFLGKHVVACKLDIGNEADLAAKLGVLWTPGLLWMTPDGRVAHANVGFFTPEEFLAEHHLGCALVAAAGGDWKEAGELFTQGLETYPKTFAAPALCYWSGVAAKKATDKVEPLLERWKQVVAEHPSSAWQMKVSFIEKKK